MDQLPAQLPSFGLPPIQGLFFRPLGATDLGIFPWLLLSVGNFPLPYEAQGSLIKQEARPLVIFDPRCTAVPVTASHTPYLSEVSSGVRFLPRQTRFLPVPEGERAESGPLR